MDDFINSQGLIFLPHILRRLANRFSDACEEVFPELGVLVPPRLVSTVHLLFDRGPQAVTDIAAAVGQSHPFVIKAVKQLKALHTIGDKRAMLDRPHLARAEAVLALAARR